MSLFGTSWDDPKTAAIMGLAGGLLQGNAGAGLQQGLLGAQRQSQLNAQSQRMMAQDAMEAEKFGFQKKQWQADLDAKQRASFDAERVRDILGKVVTGEVDAPTAIAAGVPADLIKAVKESKDYGRPKGTRQIEVDDGKGGKRIALVDDYGQEVAGYAGYVPPQLVNLGDRQVFTTPTAGAAFKVGMSPSERDASARGWASNRLAQDRFAFDQQGGAEGMKPKLVDGQWVTPPTGMRPGESRPASMPTAVKEANEALALIRQAEQIIPASTGSYAGAAIDQAGRVFGVSTAGDKAAAQLKALEGALVSKMPKMSGPQSDKDVLLYKQMAGEIGDPTVPNERKMAALEVIKEIQQRNAGAQTPMRPAGSMGSGSFGMQPNNGWSIKPLP